VAQGSAVPEQRLVQKYTSLAGSEDNAASLVTGLRDGSEIQLSPPTGSSDPATSFTPPTGKMGFGNVNIALALTEARLADVTNPTLADIQNALMNSTDGILTLRAQGMGWGEIAHAFDLKLGELMRASKDAGPAKGSERAQAQRLAGESRATRGRSEAARAERFERPEKFERPERGGGRPERVCR
jgi:hypothetical protein